MNYRDKFYSKYVSNHTVHLYGEAGLNEIKKQFQAWQGYFGRFLPADKNAKILDAGCGNGGFVYWLQQIGYRNAEGIDVSREQVEVAEKLGIKNIYRADIKEFLILGTSDAPTGDVPNIKSKNVRTSPVAKLSKPYDLIFLRDVIEHFAKEEILEILELVYKSLKDNGILIIQTSNAESPFSGRFRYGDFTHEISFTKESVRQVLLVSGFKKVETYGTKPIIHGVKSFIRFILWKGIELCLRFYLLIETGSAKGIFTQNLIVVAKK